MVPSGTRLPRASGGSCVTIRASVTTVPMGKVATMAQNLVVRARTPVQHLKVVQQAAEAERF